MFNLIFFTMKKMTKISLHNLGQAELAEKEQKLLKGGVCVCVGGAYCPCRYAGSQEGPDDSFYGGSGVDDNSEANFDSLVTNVNHG